MNFHIHLYTVHVPPTPPTEPTDRQPAPSLEQQFADAFQKSRTYHAVPSDRRGL